MQLPDCHEPALPLEAGPSVKPEPTKLVGPLQGTNVHGTRHASFMMANGMA